MWGVNPRTLYLIAPWTWPLKLNPTIIFWEVNIVLLKLSTKDLQRKALTTLGCQSSLVGWAGNFSCFTCSCHTLLPQPSSRALEKHWEKAEVTQCMSEPVPWHHNIGQILHKTLEGIRWWRGSRVDYKESDTPPGLLRFWQSRVASAFTLSGIGEAGCPPVWWGQLTYFLLPRLKTAIWFQNHWLGFCLHFSYTQESVEGCKDGAFF